MSFKPSKYQKAIFDFLLNGKGNLIVNAVAGSGKSTTLLEGVGLLLPKLKHNQNVVMTAFNRHIANELKEKASNKYDKESASKIFINTTHSIGFSSITSFLQYKKGIKLDKDFFDKDPIKSFNDKLTMLIDQFCQQSEYVKGKIKDLYEVEGYEDSQVRKIIEDWKDNFFDIFNKSMLELPNNEKEVIEVAKKHEIDGLESYDYRLVLDFMQFYIDFHKEPHNIKRYGIGFPDMIFLPAMIEDFVPKKFDIVLIDEAQDINNAQRKLLFKLIKTGGRFIAVGDPRQAIYAFAGANARSFELFKDIPNTDELPLSCCYRCGKEIIRFAQTLVPHIEAYQDSPQGLIDYASIDDVRTGDLVLCRYNAPLFGVYFSLLEKGIKVVFKKKDIAKSLVKFIDSKEWFKIKDSKELIAYIENWIPEQEESKIDRFKDYLRVIKVFVLMRKCITKEEIKNQISKIFLDKDKKGVQLCTIHGAKGLENDRVFVLCDNAFPHSKAKGEQYQQELNLAYVAYTRAMKELYLVNDVDYFFEGDCEKSKRFEAFMGRH